MKTLITGGCGFVGSHLVKRLVKEGRDVIVVDDLSRGKKEAIKDLKVDFKEIDLMDLYGPVSCFEDVDTVFHLAAKIGGIETLHGSEENELRILQDNLRIDANVFQLCRDNNVKKLIYTSSVSVYPIDKMVFIEEDFDFTNPEGGYGWAKVMGEYQLNLMKNCDVGIARIFNTYGEGGVTDETAFVINRFIRQAIKGEDLTIYDGMQTRCYLYISDCIDALMKIEELAGKVDGAFNIASDKIVTINELAKKIIKISGKDLNVKTDYTKPIGPWSRVARIQRARKILNWQPKIGLDEGLERTYRYWKNKFFEK